jgi:hypothetical protein
VSDWSSIVRRLQAWQQDPAGVGRADVNDLLVDCGYRSEQAADYRYVTLFTKPGWPRWTFVANESGIPASYLHRIADTLLARIQRDGLT